MLDKFSHQLSSIKVKLFLCFWLILFSTFLITRFVTEQMNIEHVAVPLDEKALHRLAMTQKWINRVKPESLDELTQYYSHRKRERFYARGLVFKNLTSNQITVAGKLPKAKLIRFLKVAEPEKPQSWQFMHFRLTGPVEIVVGTDRYQMFYTTKSGRPKHFGMFVMQLPISVRLGIPVVISALFCWLLARSLSRPISNISDVAERLGDGELSARVDKDDLRRDELGSLARNFNAMARKIDNNVTAQQRLLGDVSHELRSPLTRLQMSLALAQQHSKKEQNSYFERCEKEVQRLDSMIGNVLTLSKYENSIVKVDKQNCSLNDIINTLVDDANFVARNNDINVCFDDRVSIELYADQQLLSSAIGNVINNAVKYSPDGGAVHVKATRRDKQVIISITDQGLGVADSHIIHLFEPFYRVAEARDRQSGGTGLGLAIAKHAIEAHQGSISASNVDPHGLKVTIKLPFTTHA